MDDDEVMLRAIAILTHGRERLAAIRSQNSDGSGMSETIARLAADLFPAVSVPLDASPAEVLESVQHVVNAGISQLVTSFVYLHTELADLHDSGETGTTTAEMLRILALDFSASPENSA